MSAHKVQSGPGSSGYAKIHEHKTVFTKDGYFQYLQSQLSKLSTFMASINQTLSKIPEIEKQVENQQDEIMKLTSSFRTLSICATDNITETSRIKTSAQKIEYFDTRIRKLEEQSHQNNNKQARNTTASYDIFKQPYLQQQQDRNFEYCQKLEKEIGMLKKQIGSPKKHKEQKQYSNETHRTMLGRDKENINSLNFDKIVEAIDATIQARRLASLDELVHLESRLKKYFVDRFERIKNICVKATASQRSSIENKAETTMSSIRPASNKGHISSKTNSHQESREERGSRASEIVSFRIDQQQADEEETSNHTSKNLSKRRKSTKQPDGNRLDNGSNRVLMTLTDRYPSEYSSIVYVNNKKKGQKNKNKESRSKSKSKTKNNFSEREQSKRSKSKSKNSKSWKNAENNNEPSVRSSSVTWRNKSTSNIKDPIIRAAQKKKVRERSRSQKSKSRSISASRSMLNKSMISQSKSAVSRSVSRVSENTSIQRRRRKQKDIKNQESRSKTRGRHASRRFETVSDKSYQKRKHSKSKEKSLKQNIPNKKKKKSKPAQSKSVSKSVSDRSGVQGKIQKQSKPKLGKIQQIKKPRNQKILRG